MAEWKVHATWSLKAQLVFGVPAGEVPSEKSFREVEERIRVFGMGGDRE